MINLQSAILLLLLVALLILPFLNYIRKLHKRLKIAENKLSTISIKQESLISNISDVIAIMDSNGIITYKSPNIEHQFGWKPEELIGKSAWLTIHQDDLPRLEEAFDSLLTIKNTKLSLEFKYRCKDGSFKDVVLNATPMFKDPNINGVLLSYHDITTRKKVRNRLIDSEIRYRTLFERSVDIVCTIDNEGNILDINSAGIELYGYTREELLKMNISELVYSKDKEKSVRYLKLLDKNGYYKMYEGRVVSKSGEVKWIQVSSTEIIENGIKIGSQDVIRDITEKREALDSLKKANVTKDKFFSIISHDLRNPFISLIGFSDLLIANIKSKKYNKIQEFAEIINETAIQGDKLLTNLLDWSKLQKGTLRNKPELLLLQELINDVKKLYLGNTLQKNINLEENICESVAMYADKNMTKTILRNLISNAIKFSPIGSTIKIEAVELEKYLKVSVIDNGVGIPSSNIEKLFKLENSISTEGTSQEKGSGLGLILCKELSEMQGGKIWVESKPNVGSSFSFTLPLQAPQ